MSGKGPIPALAQDEADKTLGGECGVRGWSFGKKVRQQMSRLLTETLYEKPFAFSILQPLLLFCRCLFEVFTAGTTTSQMTSLALC